MSENVTGKSTARKSFYHLKYGHFHISNLPCSGKLSGFEKDVLDYVNLV